MLKKKILLSLFLFILIILLVSCKKTVKIGNKTFDTSKIYSICIAQSDESEINTIMRKSFVVRLKDLGLVEDVNVKFYYENAKNEIEFADIISDTFIEKKPDLIVSIGQLMTETFCNKIKGNGNINVIFVDASNIKKIGICDDNYNPIYNMTGITSNHYIKEKMNKISTEYKDVKRLGIIYDAKNNASLYDIDYYKFYATACDIDIYTVSVNNVNGINKAVESIASKTDALILLDDYLISSNLDKVVEKYRTKNIFTDKEEDVKKGAKLLIEFDRKYMGQKAADIAKDVLFDGKNLKTIPINNVD